MVTDVTYLCSVMNQQQAIMNDSKSTALITRDLLGGGAACDLDSSKELDLDLHVPSGFEKRLDLKSGKVYLQRCKSPNTSSSSSDHKQHQGMDQTVSKLQDLNFPPSSKKALNLFDDTSLDLNLVTLSSSSSSPPAYRSVCTLDKVKSALERAERETIKKRSVSIPNNSCSSPGSNSSSSIKETMFLDDEDDRSSQAYAAGCPSCLLYVLISRSNPRCPRCNMTVPSPTDMKKPRIDLNISI
ncbi:hypothetical protein SSX86_024462 [Deinandra increscens subsp. villosa]|uniref:GIR1-like zinc ribbon domain-containing protein n=1 Tax=Deinandra increscens subsp. villosa TaxID=3103831 RepID=A0AAP0CN35_9ASTR